MQFLTSQLFKHVNTEETTEQAKHHKTSTKAIRNIVVLTAISFWTTQNETLCKEHQLAHTSQSSSLLRKLTFKNRQCNYKSTDKRRQAQFFSLSVCWYLLDTNQNRMYMGWKGWVFVNILITHLRLSLLYYN